MVTDPVSYKLKLRIVYGLLLQVVMCFCNDEGLLIQVVGPRTVLSWYFRYNTSS